MNRHKKTTTAVLRQILGHPISSEQSLSAMTGLSVSAIKKLSAGILPVSMKSAEALSKATGVSSDWLLKQDPKIPPVEIDNQTPYTRLSFDQYANRNSQGMQPASGGVAESLVSVVSSLLLAEMSGRASSAKNDLWAFSKMMTVKYASTRQTVDPQIVEKVLGEAMRVSGWVSGETSTDECLPVNNAKNTMSSLAISFKGLEEFRHLTTPPAATPDAERAEIV